MTLIERLQEADGPNRELFIEAAGSLWGFYTTPKGVDHTEWLKRWNRFGSLLNAEAWLDAAMMLVDLERFSVALSIAAQTFATVTRFEDDPMVVPPDWVVLHDHPALALCIAALSAQEASNG